MLLYLTLAGDLLLQLTAACLAIRLIRVTGKSMAWIFISLAIVAMALSRGYVAYQWLALGKEPDLLVEIFKLAISGLMLTGVALIGPIFRRLQESEKLIHQSEQRYRTIVETAHEGIGVLDAEDRITYVNPRMSAIFGYSAAELLGRQVLDLINVEERERAQNNLARRKQEKTREVLEYHLRRKDGAPVWVSAAQSPIIDASGEYLGTVSMVSDITSSKHTEEALRESEKKLRFLTSRLLIAQEQERQKISLELHEDLGQTLQALRLQTSHIKQGLQEDQRGLYQECEDLLLHLNAIINRIRGLAWELGPNMLEDLGLLASLRHLIDDFCKHYHIKWCQTDFDKIDHLLSPTAQLNIFRIFQEALSNVGQHSQASHVVLTIKEHPEGLAFTLSDNGKGFDAAEVMSRPDTWAGPGLFAIDERVKILGGCLHIDSHPQRGTKLHFTLPVPS